MKSIFELLNDLDKFEKTAGRCAAKKLHESYDEDEDWVFSDDPDEELISTLYDEHIDAVIERIEEQGFTNVSTELSTQGGRSGYDFFDAEKNGKHFSGMIDYDKELDILVDAVSGLDDEDAQAEAFINAYAEIIIKYLKPQR